MSGFKNLFSKGITAVLCQNEEIAAGIYKAAGEVKIGIPDDLSLVCLSDREKDSFFYPALSMVSLPSFSLGEQAASSIIGIIEKDKSTPESSEHQDKIRIRPGDSLASPKESIISKSKIVVVGSLNIDVVIRVADFPTVGETVISKSVTLIPGGKGANQAVGVGKLGGNVYMIGKIGNDHEGKILYQSLYDNNVNVEGVTIDDSRATGKAYIYVSNTGESMIVVYPGANGNLSPDYLEQHLKLFDNAKYCLLPMENPPEVIDYTINISKKKRIKVILKPPLHIM